MAGQNIARQESQAIWGEGEGRERETEREKAESGRYQQLSEKQVVM